MGKTLKYILWALGGLILIVVLVVAYVAATFDPEKYKPDIVNLVKEKTGRTLTIDGKIGLTFFPKIGAAVERLTLSEPNGDKAFARIGEAKVAVALIPLFSKRVVVDRVTLADLSVDLLRRKDGTTNFDDLLGGKEGKAPATPGKAPAPAGSGAPPAIDIGGIELRNANVGWRDEREGTDVRLSRLDLRTDRIASGVPGKLSLSARVDGTQPKLALDAALSTGYRIEFDTQATALSDLEAEVKGDAPGFQGLDATLKGTTLAIDPKGQRVDLAGVQVVAKSKEGLEARFSIPKLALAPDQLQSEAIDGTLKFARETLSVDAKVMLAAAQAKAKEVEIPQFAADVNFKDGDRALQGKLATPISLNLAASEVRLAKIAGDFTFSSPDLPAKTAKVALSGAAAANWAKQTAQTDLVAKVDDSTLQAKASVAGFEKPAITFDVEADRLNVDRYLPPKKAGSSGGASPPAGGGSAPAAQGGDTPVDLSALKAFNANGSLRIGALTVSNIKAQNVQVKLRAAEGRVAVEPIAAQLYQGTVAGNAHIDANSNAIALKQELKGIEIGPLLRDATGNDKLEGRGNVNLDVTTAGATVGALKKGLNGTSNFSLRDGAIKGVDVTRILQAAKALRGRDVLQAQTEAGQKTDFTELSGSFVIKNGIAHNSDLQGKSPLLRLSGAGDINIGTDSVDYTLKASVVGTSTGQGGKDLADVHGVTAPVHITGKFDNLKYEVDVTAIAADVAKEAVTREIERRLGGGQQGQQGSGGNLGDTLRGLLRRK